MNQESLSEEEVNHLRESLSGDLAPRLSVKWVAEVSGFTDEEVRDHLRAVRAERALVAPLRARNSMLTSTALLATASVVALLTGVVVTLRRMELQSIAHLVPNARGELVSPTPAAKSAAPPKVITPARTYLRSEFAFPLGTYAEFVTDEYQVSSIYPSVRPKLRTYEAVSGELEQAMLRTIPRLKPMTSRPGPDIIEYDGYRRVRRQPGTVNYYIKTWGGVVAGYVNIPIQPGDMTEIHEAAQRAYAEALAQQKRGLRLRAPDDLGILQPPPGYRITYSGRRSDTQDGGRLSFVPVDPQVYKQRLIEAALDAIERDALPPKGAWTQSEQEESKLKPPNRGRLRLEGFGRTFDFNVSSNPVQARKELETMLNAPLEPLKRANVGRLEPFN